MEKKVIVRANISNLGRPIAESERGVRVSGIDVPSLEGGLTAYSFPQVTLDRTVLFEHMQGRSLQAFFNGCVVDFTTDGGTEGTSSPLPVTYVHGRSEALRGNVTVSAVVLAEFPAPISYREIAAQLPEIYKIISACL